MVEMLGNPGTLGKDGGGVSWPQTLKDDSRM